MFIVGGGNNTSQQDLGNGLPPAISESQHGANSYWTEVGSSLFAYFVVTLI
jgi:hypothetical protein